MPSHRLQPHSFGTTVITAPSSSPSKPALTPPSSPTSSASSLDEISLENLSISSSTPSSPTLPSFRPRTPPTAIIPTFDPENGWLALYNILGDPTLCTLTYNALGSPLGYHIASEHDVEPLLDCGEVSWAIRSSICSMIGDGLNPLADFILCAGNDHNPWTAGGRPDIPHFIPAMCLEQLGLSRLPGIIIFRGYSDATIHQLTFATKRDAIEYIAIARHVYHYFIHWIANAIRMSVEFGYQTAWRWSAAIGMSHTEFTHRITRQFVYEGYQSLARMMSHLLVRNTLDFREAINSLCSHPSHI
jgi:hypothetical protein